MFNISLAKALAKASMNCLFIRVAATEVCCRVVLPLELTLSVHRTSSCRRRSAKERVEKYKCNICSYRSKWSHGLSNHMRRHNNTLFKCAECDYSTPWKGDLTNHMRLHSGEFIFQLKGLLVNVLRVYLLSSDPDIPYCACREYVPVPALLVQDVQETRLGQAYCDSLWK